MKTKFFTSIFASMMAVLAFTACSDDNEPKNEPSEGKQMVDWVNMQLGSQKENLWTDEDGNKFVLTADSKEEAHNFCESLIRKSWDGKNTTITIPDGFGTISLSDASNLGAFYLLSFNKLGYMGSFSLLIATPEFLNGDNSFINVRPRPGVKDYKCENCNKVYSLAVRPETCPNCGSKNIRVVVY